jgi:hypothetical protein
MWLAANGDKVYFEYSGYPVGDPPTVPGQEYETLTEFEIVGGTGRFEGAVGSGEMLSAYVFQPTAQVWPFNWDTTGTIGY